MNKTKDKFDPTSVALAQVAAELGAPIELIVIWAERLGLVGWTVDWRGVKSLCAADAYKLIAAFRAERAEHSRWEEACKKIEIEERERKSQEHKEEQRRVAEQQAQAKTQRQRELAERARRRFEERYAAEAAAEAARPPALPSFEEWKRTAKSSA